MSLRHEQTRSLEVFDGHAVLLQQLSVDAGLLQGHQRRHHRITEVRLALGHCNADRVGDRHRKRLFQLVRIGLDGAVDRVDIVDVSVGTAGQDGLDAVLGVVVELDFRLGLARRLARGGQCLNQRHFDVAGVLGGNRTAHRGVDAGDLLRVALGHQHAVEDLRVGDEVGRLGAFFSGVDVGDDDVGLAGFQRGQQRRKRHRLVSHLEAQAGAERLAQVDVEADVLVRIVRVYGLVARGVRIDRVDQCLALELRVLGLQRAAFGRDLGDLGMNRGGSHRESRKAQGRDCHAAQTGQRGKAPDRASGRERKVLHSPKLLKKRRKRLAPCQLCCSAP